MLTTEEKLRHFSQSVFAKAQKQADTVTQSAQRAAKVQTDAFENRCLDNAYHTIQNQTRKIRRHAQENVARQKLEARRELFKKREAMVDEVFSAAAERLAAFRASSGYLAFLKKSVAEAETVLGTTALQVTLDSADSAFVTELQSAYPDAEFKTGKTGSRLPGGLYAADTAAARTADLTLESLLRDEKTRFLAESGFTL